MVDNTVEVNGSLEGSPRDREAGSPAYRPFPRSVWYSWTCLESGALVGSVESLNLSMFFSGFVTNDEGSLQFAYATDYGSTHLSRSLSLPVKQGKTYLIGVGDYLGIGTQDLNRFLLRLKFYPPATNSSFATRQSLGQDDRVVALSLSGRLRASANGLSGHAWYRWKALRDGPTLATLKPSNPGVVSPRVQLSAYQVMPGEQERFEMGHATSESGLAHVVPFDARAGEEYAFEISGEPAYPDEYDLVLSDAGSLTVRFLHLSQVAISTRSARSAPRSRCWDTN